MREWYVAGKPKSTDVGHDFRPWSQTCDWICQNILGTGPLMDGHQAAKERTANPALLWLRDVALAFVKIGNQEWLRAHDILDMALASELDVPGFILGDNPDEEQCRKRLLQAIGRKLSQAFKTDEILIDGIKCERSEEKDEINRYYLKQYRFMVCGYSAANPAANETRTAANAANTYQPLNRGNKYTDTGNNIAVTECSDRPAAIAADQPQVSVQDEAACGDCNKMTAVGYCRHYGKSAWTVMNCNKKEQYVAK